MFARAVEIAPGHAPAHAGLAEAQALLHAYYPPAEEALAQADQESARAVALDPALAAAQAVRGFTLFLLKRLAEAEEAFAWALALDPGHFEAWYYAGRTAFQAGRYQEAARLFGEATRVRPDHTAAFFAAQATEALGARDAALPRYREALALVEAHMDLNPDDPRAATIRAVALLRTGRAAEGLRWAEQALALEPQDAGVRYNVACLFALEGQSARALEQLEEVVRRGFRNRAWMERDPDLASLRAEPRFTALMASIG
jgi:adenylate cyclase